MRHHKIVIPHESETYHHPQKECTTMINESPVTLAQVKSWSQRHPGRMSWGALAKAGSWISMCKNSTKWPPPFRGNKQMLVKKNLSLESRARLQFLEEFISFPSKKEKT